MLHNKKIHSRRKPGIEKSMKITRFATLIDFFMFSRTQNCDPTHVKNIPQYKLVVNLNNICVGRQHTGIFMDLRYIE